jgi:ABC-2 type transport system permease protein
MPSKAITENLEYSSTAELWRPGRESAPSVVRAEDPTVARWLGFAGMMFVILGTAGMLLTALGKASWIGPIGSSLCSVIGMALLLFHATVDAEVQVRRTYGILGYLWLVAALVVTVLPVNGVTGTLFFPYGFLFLMLALFFLLPFAHNETELAWRRSAVAVFGVVGAILALTGLVGSNVDSRFLLGGNGPYGLLLSALGLGYLWAFVSLRGTADNLGYRAGLAVGVGGIVIFLVALARSLVPALTHAQSYLVPTGLILMGLGLLYAFVAAGICSDNRMLVLTRRELSAFFYSPMAYIVMVCLTLVAGLLFYIFLDLIIRQSQPNETPLVEPVIRFYIIDWFPIICVTLVVPALTMRLLSEERRSGTLEVLLTAPLGEGAIVVSKFIAALVLYMFVWLPWGLYLAALRIQGGQSFDYYPLLSFFFALVVTGAGFLSMGLFFSSLTRNQIIAFFLTVVGMLALLMVFFLKRFVTPDSTGYTILSYISYVDLWIDSLEGKLSPRFLMFHISAAIFWLFVTIKVMQARRWT